MIRNWIAVLTQGTDASAGSTLIPFVIMLVVFDEPQPAKTSVANVAATRINANTFFICYTSLILIIISFFSLSQHHTKVKLFYCPRQSVQFLSEMCYPTYLTIACHSERSVSEVEESLRFKILRLFAVANFASQTTQDDNKLSVLDIEDI